MKMNVTICMPQYTHNKWDHAFAYLIVNPLAVALLYLIYFVVYDGIQIAAIIGVATYILGLIFLKISKKQRPLVFVAQALFGLHILITSRIIWFGGVPVGFLAMAILFFSRIIAAKKG